MSIAFKKPGRRTSVGDEEVALIAGLITYPEQIDKMSTEIEEKHFSQRKLATLWQVLKQMKADNRPVNLVTVSTQLNTLGLAERIGLAWVAGLTDHAPPSSYAVAHHARAVREAATWRALEHIAKGIMLAADGEGFPMRSGPRHLESSAAAVSLVTDLLHKQCSSTQATSDKTIAEWWDSWYNELQAIDRGEVEAAMKTGFTALDGKTGGGMRRGQMWVVAGRPASGKTAFALSMVNHLGASARKVGIIQLEMPGEQVVNRLASGLVGISIQRLRDADLTSDEWLRIEDFREQTLSKWQGRMETMPLDKQRIASTLRRWHAMMGGMDAIFIDYLQLVQTDGRSNETQAIGEITKMLKLLAKELQCCIVVLSQLSRKCEERPDPRPKPSDLRSSGQIEQDADVILFPFRPCVYDETQPHDGGELIIAKQRDGECGTLPMLFRGARAQWCDAPPDDPIIG